MPAVTKPAPAVGPVTKLVRKKFARKPTAASPTAAPTPDVPKKIFCTAAELAAEYAGLQWLVEGVLLQGQPGVLGGPRKSFKTAIATELAVSVGLGDQHAGNLFLGNFKCGPPQPVAILNGESGDATLVDLLQRICKNKGVTLADVPSLIFSQSVRALHTPEGRDQLTAELRDAGIRLVVVDPLYLALDNVGGHASNLFAMGPALRRVSDCILDAGATPLMVHHCRKSGGKGKDGCDFPELDALTMAGVAEFARQWILLDRIGSHKSDRSGRHSLAMSIGSSAGHWSSHKVDVDEGVPSGDPAERRWSTKVSTVAGSP